MTETYTIRPLEWRESAYSGWDCHLVDTPFGQLSVHSVQGKFWKWGFRNESGECDSLAHGKQLAEAYWRERIMQALVKVEK